MLDSLFFLTHFTLKNNSQDHMVREIDPKTFSNNWITYMNLLMLEFQFLTLSFFNKFQGIGDRIVITDSAGSKVPEMGMSWIVEGKSKSLNHDF